MTEPSATVKEKLARATARRAAEMGVPGGAMPEPPAPQQQTLKQPTLPDTESASPNGSPAAGSGTAKYLLVDHYFGGSNGTFWTYDGTTWRGLAPPSRPMNRASRKSPSPPTRSTCRGTRMTG
ncbi:MAG: hypothetical protein ACRDQI_05355 [Pseudonocardiaceae bacterium]